MEIFKKLNEFRKKVEVVKKDAKNPYYNSKYATLESVIATIENPLNELNLNYYQIVDDNFLKTIVYNVDNPEEKIESRIRLLLNKEDMQMLGSAITYARRYGLVSIFGLEQEDDDGNATVENPTKKNFSKVEDILDFEELKNQLLNAKSTKQLYFLSKNHKVNLSAEEKTELNNIYKAMKAELDGDDLD